MGRALLDVVWNLLRLPFLPVWWVIRRLQMPRARWVHVKIRKHLVEVDRPLHVLARFVPGMTSRRPTSLSALRELVDKVVVDEKVDGVIWEIPTLHTGWSHAAALRDLLVKLRLAGKKVVAYLPEGAGNRELYVTSAADRVLTSPHATIAPMGVAASRNYVKGLLDRFGVQIEVHRRREFKTAAEPAVSEHMSEAQREQIGALLDTVDRALVAALAERPAFGGDEGKVRALFDDAIFSGQAAREVGLVDALCYEDGLAQAIVGAGEKAPELVRAPRYFRYHASRFFRAVGPRPFVAVVPVHGAITAGGGGPAIGGPPASHEAVIGAIRAAARDPRAVGVVLHVDSPGGSALASDLIHREVELLKAKKPVVACFGEVAASGGYYVAAPAHAIVCQPLAITGSIGVVAARLVAKDLLEGMGVRTEVLRRAPHADLVGNPRPMDADEHAILEREIDAFYKVFVGVVAKGRNKSEAEVDALAGGRVWSGKDAKERGLVDRLGGLDAAIEEVRSRLTWVPTPLRPLVETRVLWPRAEDVPPIPAAAIAGQVAKLDPSIADLVQLVGAGERMLFYATGLPEIH